MRRNLTIFTQTIGEDVMKYSKIILIALLTAIGMNFSLAQGMTPGVPAGWTFNDVAQEKYQIGVDTTIGSKEHPVLYIGAKQANENDFASLTQVIESDAFSGKVVGLTVSAKFIGDSKNSEFWIRCHKSEKWNAIASSFGKEIQDWSNVSVNMKLPVDGCQLEIGIGVRGQGQLWIRDIHFNTATVDQKTLERKPLAERVKLAEPQAEFKNLNFSER